MHFCLFGVGALSGSDNSATSLVQLQAKRQWQELYKLSNLSCSKFKGILVKTPGFQCRGGAVSIPDWGNNILHALWHGPKQNKKNHKASDHTESSGIKTNTWNLKAYCIWITKYIYLFIYFISWRLITLQYCSGFCHTLTRISHGFTCIPHPDPHSHFPLRPIPLGLPSASGPSTCLMHPT